LHAKTVKPAHVELEDVGTVELAYDADEMLAVYADGVTVDSVHVGGAETVVPAH
jgi:hypothetical protein